MDNLTPEQRRKNMQNIHSFNTLPERILAKELKQLKVYFSQHSNKLPGKPDFIFRKKKLVVFVDSDFWHCNPRRFKMPKTNQIYWKNKIQRNIERDKEVNLILRSQGWRVIRIWESMIKRQTSYCIGRILKYL